MITGKDVHEAARAHLEKQGFEWLKWEDVVVPQAYYNDVAAKLNEQFIAPMQEQIESLKALVRDFVTLLEDDELMIEDSSDGWWTKREETLTLAKQLIGEENQHAAI